MFLILGNCKMCEFQLPESPRQGELNPSTFRVFYVFPDISNFHFLLLFISHLSIRICVHYLFHNNIVLQIILCKPVICMLNIYFWLFNIGIFKMYSGLLLFFFFVFLFYLDLLLQFIVLALYCLFIITFIFLDSVHCMQSCCKI